MSTSDAIKSSFGVDAVVSYRKLSLAVMGPVGRDDLRLISTIVGVCLGRFGAVAVGVLTRQAPGKVKECEC